MAGRRGAWRQTAAELAIDVLDAIGPGDVVMAKGSKGSKASSVVQALLDAALTPNTNAAGKTR